MKVTVPNKCHWFEYLSKYSCDVVVLVLSKHRVKISKQIDTQNESCLFTLFAVSVINFEYCLTISRISICI